MAYFYLNFYACLERSPDVESNPGPGVLFLVSAEYSSVMWGAFTGTWAPWQWLRLSAIYCCALCPWSLTSVMCQSFWFLNLVVLCSLGCLGARGMAAPMRDGWVLFCTHGNCSSDNLGGTSRKRWISRHCWQHNEKQSPYRDATTFRAGNRNLAL